MRPPKSMFWVKLEVPIQAAILNVSHIGIVRVVGNIIFQSTGSVNLCKPWTPKPYSRTKNCHDIFHGLWAMGHSQNRRPSCTPSWFYWKELLNSESGASTELLGPPNPVVGPRIVVISYIVCELWPIPWIDGHLGRHLDFMGYNGKTLKMMPSLNSLDPKTLYQYPEFSWYLP